jgi:hypothetical protein
MTTSPSKIPPDIPSYIPPDIPLYIPPDIQLANSLDISKDILSEILSDIPFDTSLDNSLDASLDNFSDNSNECIICLESDLNTNICVNIENLDKELFFINCKCVYFIHPLCIMTWLELNSSCPMCRKKIHIPYSDINSNTNQPIHELISQLNVEYNRDYDSEYNLDYNTQVSRSSSSLYTTQIIRNTQSTQSTQSIRDMNITLQQQNRIRLRRIQRKKFKQAIQKVFYYSVGIILIICMFLRFV